jgi:hypothetical protein
MELVLILWQHWKFSSLILEEEGKRLNQTLEPPYYLLQGLVS